MKNRNITNGENAPLLQIPANKLIRAAKCKQRGEHKNKSYKILCRILLICSQMQIEILLPTSLSTKYFVESYLSKYNCKSNKYKASYLTKEAWNVEERHQKFLQRLLVLSPTRARRLQQPKEYERRMEKYSGSITIA